jgi:hypothetical protein
MKHTICLNSFPTKVCKHNKQHECKRKGRGQGKTSKQYGSGPVLHTALIPQNSDHRPLYCYFSSHTEFVITFIIFNYMLYSLHISRTVNKPDIKLANLYYFSSQDKYHGYKLNSLMAEPQVCQGPDSETLHAF